MLHWWYLYEFFKFVQHIFHKKNGFLKKNFLGSRSFSYRLEPRVALDTTFGRAINRA